VSAARLRLGRWAVGPLARILLRVGAACRRGAGVVESGAA